MARLCAHDGWSGGSERRRTARGIRSVLLFAALSTFAAAIRAQETTPTAEEVERYNRVAIDAITAARNATDDQLEPAIAVLDAALAAPSETLRLSIAMTARVVRADCLRLVGQETAALAACDAILERCNRPGATPTTERTLAVFRVDAAIQRARILNSFGLLDQTKIALDQVEAALGILTERIESLRAEIATTRDAGDPGKLAGLEKLELRLTEANADLLRLRGDAVECRANFLLACDDQAGTIEFGERALRDFDVLATGSRQRTNVELRVCYARFLLAAKRRTDHADVREALAEIVTRRECDDYSRTFGGLLWVEALLNAGDFAGADRLLETVEAYPNSKASIRNALQFAILRLQCGMRGGDMTRVRRDRDALRLELERYHSRWAKAAPRPGGYGIFNFMEIRNALSEYGQASAALGEGHEQALEWLMRFAALDSLSRRLDARAPSIEELRLGLLAGSDRAVLVYLPANERTDLYCVTSEGVRYESLARSDDIVPLARAVGRELREPPSGDSQALDALRTELGEALLPARVRDLVRGRPGVSIVGGDLIDESVFEALPFDEHEYFGLGFAIDHLPSLSYACEADRRARTIVRTPGACLIGAPLATRTVAEDGDAAVLLAQRLPPIPLDLAGANDLLAAAGGGAAFVGATATLAALDHPLVDHCVSLGFLTHGSLDFLSPRPARLLLVGADGTLDWVGADDLERSFAPPRRAPPVVSLMACNSGRAPKRRGDSGGPDLAGAFLANGSIAVLTAMRDVEFAVARLATAAFTQALAEGVPPAEAARRARNAVHGVVDYRAAFHHTNLRLVGFGQRAYWRAIASAATGEAGTPVEILAGIGIFLLGGTWAWARRRRNGKSW